MTVMPFIFLNNSAVSMSAIKVVALFLVTLHDDAELAPARERIEQTYADRLVRALIAKLQAPRYELRYFFIRNILVFLHTHLRTYFAPHLIEFLIKYDDPIFIKLEKVNVLIALADEASGQQVLNELVIYVRDSDVELSSKTVRAIGTIAARVPTLAPACVAELQKLIATKVPRIVEDAAIVLHTVLRYFPGRYVDVVPTLCEALTVLNNVEAEAAIIWIVGENAKRVPGAIGNYLSLFTENFLEQPRMVQLAVLTALAKIYARDDDGKHMKEAAFKLLTAVTTQSLGSCLPDLRDRALFYTRLLSSDLATAKRILGVSDLSPMDPPATTLLMGASEREVLSELGSLVVVEQKTLAVLLGEGAIGAYRLGENENSESDDDDAAATDAKAREEVATPVGRLPAGAAPTVASPTTPSAPTKGPLMTSSAFEVLLPASAGSGVEISMRWSQLGTRLVLLCRLQLHEGDEYVHQARVLNLQVNRNMFSLGVAQAFPVTVLEPEEKPAELSLVMSRNNARQPTRDIQIAAEISPIGVRYFTAPPIPPTMLLLPATSIDRGVFLDALKEQPQVAWTMPPQLAPLRCDPVRISVNAMRVHAFDLVHRKEFYTSKNATLNAFFLYAETLSRQKLFFELTFNREEVLLLTARADYAPLAAFFGEYLMHVVQFIGSSARALR
ncbi:AP-1 complex subunit beta-1 [Strigomonas culicis]|nr:AP-1 complex subunit beta-1 [Strigomonas culicis]|eukprot:EPY27811.1 AP-1 complex subunit beta-1 [Strigomonas culicis]